MTEAMDAALAVLVDRETIKDLLNNKWSMGVDKLNWKLVRSLYDDEVEVHFHDPALPGVPEPKLWKADEWLNFCRAIEGFDVTQHYLSNFVFKFEGDTANVQTYLFAEHHLDGKDYAVGGEYNHRFRKSGGEWKLNYIQLEIWWTRGDAGLFEKAAAMGQNGTAPRSKNAIRF